MPSALRPPLRSRVSLALLVAAGIALRCHQLGAAGFSEDEIGKLRAVEAYRHLDFTVNAEHPMLLKLAVLGSMTAFSAVNQVLPRSLEVPAEAALRFPNALAGGLTTICIFLVSELLFGVAAAWVAAALWALDVNAIAISRIAKEDSLFLLFMLLGVWCYERGKRAAPAPRAFSPEGQRWFRRAGAAFGIMTAAKYMPYYFGLHVVFCRAADPHPGRNRPDKAGYFGAMAVAFLAANFAVLLPPNWAHIARYTTEQLMPHTGYVFGDAVYVNTPSATPWGVPSYFYLEYILTKTPLVVLAAIAAGVAVMVLHPRDRGIVFLRVFCVLILLPYSLAASKFVRYMLPLFAVLDMMAAVGIVRLHRAITSLPGPALARRVAVALGTVLIVGEPLAAVTAAAPYFGLYRNPISRRIAGDRLLFPHCELYDAGMREAARHVAGRARPGALVLSEAPGVVSRYAGRPDLRSRSIAHEGIPRDAEVWVLVQDGRVYFENLPAIAMLRATRRAAAEVRVGDVTAVQVFHLEAPPSALHALQ